MSLAADDPVKLRRVIVKVGRNDTLAGLASRYEVSVAQLRKWNQLEAKRAPQPGQRLVVFLPKKTGPLRQKAARSQAPVSVTKKRVASAPASPKKKNDSHNNTSQLAKN